MYTQAGRLIGHIARDSTAIQARERFPGMPQHKSIPKRRPGRPRKTERALSGRRLPRQRWQSLPEMLAELPHHCSLGVNKKTGSGHQQYWRGYKLHLDVADGQIPISCSQRLRCMIPKLQSRSQRFQECPPAAQVAACLFTPARKFYPAKFNRNSLNVRIWPVPQPPGASFASRSQIPNKSIPPTPSTTYPAALRSFHPATR